MSTQPTLMSKLPPLQGLSKTLQMDLIEATAECVVMTMPVIAQHHQSWGYLHGGASVALAETAATVGAFLHCPPGKVAFGQEINANHLRPMRAGLLTATALPLHLGRTSQVWEIHLRDEQKKLICTARCTLAVITSDTNRNKSGEEQEEMQHAYSPNTYLGNTEDWVTFILDKWGQIEEMKVSDFADFKRVEPNKNV